MQVAVTDGTNPPIFNCWFSYDDKFNFYFSDEAYYFQIWFGHFKDIPSKIDTDVLKQKDSLSKMCVAFFKERLPASFDFKRIKSLNLKIDKSQKNLKIAIKIKVDAKEFT